MRSKPTLKQRLENNIFWLVLAVASLVGVASVTVTWMIASAIYSQGSQRDQDAIRFATTAQVVEYFQRGNNSAPLANAATPTTGSVDLDEYKTSLDAFAAKYNSLSKNFGEQRKFIRSCKYIPVTWRITVTNLDTSETAFFGKKTRRMHVGFYSSTPVLSAVFGQEFESQLLLLGRGAVIEISGDLIVMDDPIFGFVKGHNFRVISRPDPAEWF